MKVYLAGDYNEPAQFRGYARELEQLGFEVSSRWVTGPSFRDIKAQCDSEPAIRLTSTREQAFKTLARISDAAVRLYRFAEECREDIDTADLVIVFAGPSGNWETGYCDALHKKMMVVGANGSPFYYSTADTTYMDTWEQAKRYLEMSRLRFGMVSR